MIKYGDNKNLLKLIVTTTSTKQKLVECHQQNRLQQQKVNNARLFYISTKYLTVLQLACYFRQLLHQDKEHLLFPFLAFSHPQNYSCLEDVLRNRGFVLIPLCPLKGSLFIQLSQSIPKVYLSSLPERKGSCPLRQGLVLAPVGLFHM